MTQLVYTFGLWLFLTCTIVQCACAFFLLICFRQSISIVRISKFTYLLFFVCCLPSVPLWAHLTLHRMEPHQSEFLRDLNVLSLISSHTANLASLISSHTGYLVSLISSHTGYMVRLDIHNPAISDVHPYQISWQSDIQPYRISDQSDIQPYRISGQ